MAKLNARPPGNKPVQLRRFWLPTAVFTASAITVGILALVKRTSEVEVSLTVRSIALPLASGPHSLFSNIKVRGLALSNFHSLTATDGGIVFKPAVKSSSQAKSVVNNVPFGLFFAEDVVLDRIEATRPGHAILTWNRAAPLSLKAVFDLPVAAYLRGGSAVTGYCDFCVSGDGSSASQSAGRHFTVVSTSKLGQELVALADKAPTVVGLEVTGPEQIGSSILAVREGEIGFESLQEGQPVSDVLTGTIRFPEFKDRTIAVPLGVFVRLRRGSNFRLRSIKLSDGIQVLVTGNASVIIVGDTSEARNRVPSYLEWFDEKHSWSLYLAAVVSLTAALWGALAAVRGQPT
jgi:hypothetical protein